MLQIGDEVLITKVVDENYEIVNKIGTIISINDHYRNGRTYRYSVQFQFKPQRGHDGHEHNGKDGYCWNVHADCVELVEHIEETLAEGFKNKAVTIRVNGSIIIIVTKKNKLVAFINKRTKNIKYGDIRTKAELEYKSIIENIIKEEK